jgi:phosphomannomutase/phosphoglucomutase
VHDIGLALSPTAYYAQFDLDAPCVAMVTASHNENGWTGVKMGAARPLTFGPDEMGRLKEIVLGGAVKPRDGGKLVREDGVAERFIADVARRVQITRPLKVVAACGNGTAGAFVPQALRAMGVAVVYEMDCDLDWTFPKYNPNPEDQEMLHEMAKAVREFGADLALGFDGDGDRCGVVDDTGEEIYADKIGLMLARDLAAAEPRRDLHRRCEVDRPLRHRPGAEIENGCTTSSTGRPATATSSARPPNWAPWPGSRSPATSSSTSRWAGATTAA